MPDNETLKFLEKMMDGFGVKLDKFQEDNFKQHRELFVDVKELMIKDAGQEGDLTKTFDKRYSSKVELKNLKEAMDGMSKLLTRVAGTVVVMMLGIIGWGASAFIGVLIDKVQAFF